MIPGGSSLPVLTPTEVDTQLDFDSLDEGRHFFGSGAVIVIDDRACMVQLALRVAQFYMHESCGKCTPCREGTRWLVQMLREVEDGTRDRERPRPAARRRATGSSASASARSATPPRCPSRATSTKFRDEFQAHIDARRLPLRRRLVARRALRALGSAPPHAHEVHA